MEKNMQQITPVEQAYARMKRGELDIRPLGNADKDVQGAYNLDSGIIKLGTYEKTTPRVLWHEHMHKILKESLGLESRSGSEEHPLKTTIQWDNIANILEEFLFPAQKMPHNEINYAEALKEKKKDFKRKDIIDLLKESFR
jgi:hypothetical protein